MYGETFYGRHTAQHQLQWSSILITPLEEWAGQFVFSPLVLESEHLMPVYT